MTSRFLVMLGILVLLIIIGIFVAIAAKKSKRPIDYYAWFWIGISWLIIGVPLALRSDNYSLIAMGLIFAVVGLVNRKKWKTNRTTWKDLSKKERRFKFIILIVLGLLIFAGLLVFYVQQNNLI